MAKQIVFTNNFSEISDDMNQIEILAHIEALGRTVDGNAQVTKTGTSFGTENTTTETVKEILSETKEKINESVNNGNDISVKFGSHTITSSATNWLLVLIAFFLFLKLIL